MKQADDVLVVHTKAHKWEAQTVLLITQHFSQINMTFYTRALVVDRHAHPNIHVRYRLPQSSRSNQRQPIAKYFREPWPRARHSWSEIPGRQVELNRRAHHGSCSGPCQELETRVWERSLVPHCCKEAAQQRLETTHYAAPPD